MRARAFATVVGVIGSSVCVCACGASAASRTSSSQSSTSASASARAANSTSQEAVDSWGVFAGGGRGGARSGGSHRHHHHHHGGRRGHGASRQKVGSIGASASGQPTAEGVPGVSGSVTEIATSNSDTYALTSSGAVYAVGNGASGELGDGSTPKLALTAVRVQFPTGVRIAKLSNPMPYDGGMAIDTRGDVWAWGNDAAQEFCQPRGADLVRPVKVPLAHVSLAVGALKHALYDAGGKIVSCGQGPDGQLGDGSSGKSVQTGTPVAVRGIPAGAVSALTSGYGDAGVLMANGTYYDWGLNLHGQVGDGGHTMATTAVKVALPAAVRQISEGGSTPKNGQAMALLSNGQLWEWGANANGQIGNGDRADQLSPARLREPAGVRFVRVNSGGASDYAITQTGQLWDWGANQYGQLGTGSKVDANISRPTRTAVHLTQVSSTAANAAGLLSAAARRA